MGRPKKNHKAITFFLSEDEHKKAQFIIESHCISYYTLAKKAFSHYVNLVDSKTPIFSGIVAQNDDDSDDLLK